MIDDPKFNYLVRELDRARKDAMAMRGDATRAVTSQFGGSAFGSSAYLAAMQKAYDTLLLDAVSGMAQVTNEICSGKPTASAVQALRAAGLALCDELSDYFRDFLGHNSECDQTDRADIWTEVGTEIVDRVVDGFQHGIIRGRAVAKEPSISIVSNVTNSPGAIQQTGIGNVQTAINPDGGKALKQALSALLASNEFTTLLPEQKAEISDLAVVMTRELEAPSPNAERLKRLGKKLVGYAEDFGIGVAASGVASVLFG